jgi:hypothetical protein
LTLSGPPGGKDHDTAYLEDADALVQRKNINAFNRFDRW